MIGPASEVIVFFNGEYVPMKSANVSLATHSLHYGTGCFEGIRGNFNSETNEVCMFRLIEHYQRMHTSAKLLFIDIPYSVDALIEITVELVKKLVKKNGFKSDVYVRPYAYKSEPGLSQLDLRKVKDGFAMLTYPLGNYLDVNRALKCKISHWTRQSDNTLPTRAKLSGNYIKTAIARTDALNTGFDEAILLNEHGNIAEGSSENIFLVINGELHTPAVSEGCLPGITRETVLQFAQNDLGLRVHERTINSSEIYFANEAFFTGTAAHISPIGQVDVYKVGDGEVGPITSNLQKLYFDIIRGKNPRYMHWYTLV